MKLKTKRILSSMLVFGMIFSVSSPLIVNAKEVIDDKTGEIIILPDEQIDEDAVEVLTIEDNPYVDTSDKSDIMNFTYSDATVETTMESLITRTENLKTNYSKTEAIDILKTLDNTMSKITKSDYTNYLSVEYDANNYTTGTFNKYKNTDYYWIAKNVLACIIQNNKDDFDSIKEAIDYIYSASYNESLNFAYDFDPSPVATKELVKPKLFGLLTNLSHIKSLFNSDISNYIDYLYNITTSQEGNFSNGSTPDKIVPSTKYEEYLNEQNKENTANPGYNEEEITDEKEETVDTGESDEKYNSEYEYIEIGEGEEYNYDYNFDGYLSAMDKISNSSQRKIKEYIIKNIYYTVDKDANYPTWYDTGVVLSEDDDIEFMKLTSALGTLTRQIEDCYLVEDDDMLLFVVEGKPLVINKVDEVLSEEIDTLLDDFDKVGFKVMLASEAGLDTNDALSEKIEKGEINEIIINDDKLILTNKPILTDDMVQLPLEQIAKELGYKVTISGNKITLTLNEAPKTSETEENSETSETTQEIITNEIVIELTVGSSTYTINDQKNSFKSKVTKTDGVVYCEFNKLAEISGYTFGYDANAGLLKLSK